MLLKSDYFVEDGEGYLFLLVLSLICNIFRVSIEDFIECTVVVFKCCLGPGGTLLLGLHG